MTQIHVHIYALSPPCNFGSQYCQDYQQDMTVFMPQTHLLALGQTCLRVNINSYGFTTSPKDLGFLSALCHIFQWVSMTP